MRLSIDKWFANAFPVKALGTSFLIVQISGFLLLISGELERLSVAWWCLDKTGSPALFGSMVAIGSVGYLAAQPAFGWLGDRYSKRAILLWAFGISAAATALLAYLSTHSEFPTWLVGSTLLIGSLATSTVPALMSGVVLELVGKSQVTDAFRVRASFGSFASIGGPILAGTLIAAVGYKLVLMLGCVLVVFALAGLANGLPSRKVDAAPLGGKGPRQFFANWWQMTSYGAKSVWVIRAERQMGVLAMITNAAMLPMVLVLIPSTVKQFFDDPAWVSGLASASLGVGVLLCSVYVMPAVKDKWSNDTQILLGRALTSVGVTGACVAVNFYGSSLNSGIATVALCVSLLASGVGLGLVNIVGSSVRSRAIPAHLRTRIFAATGFLSGAAIPLGNLMQGTLLATLGPHWALVLVASLMWVSVLVYLKSTSIRSIMRTDDSQLDGEYGRLYPQFAAEAGARDGREGS